MVGISNKRTKINVEILKRDIQISRKEV